MNPVITKSNKKKKIVAGSVSADFSNVNYINFNFTNRALTRQPFR